MESLKKGMRYQLMESKKFLVGFWSVMLIVNIFFYILNNIGSLNSRIGLSIGISGGVNNSISVVGANLMAILIALLVYNYESNYESFPLAISLSMTRKEYFLSFLVDNIFIAFICATIQGILLKIDPFFVKLINRTPLYDLKYFNTVTDNVFYIIFMLFILFLAFTAFWNLFASINYKFGYKIWLILIGTNILLSIININFIGSILNAIGNILAPRLGVFQILVILASTVAFYMLNYIVVIRTDVKKVRG